MRKLLRGLGLFVMLEKSPLERFLRRIGSVEEFSRSLFAGSKTV
jgi:hypothetical protein